LKSPVDLIERLDIEHDAIGAEPGLFDIFTV